MVRNLTEVKPKIPLLGVSHTDIPLQGASTSSKPTAEGQGHLVSQAGGPRLVKKALSECTRWKLKKIRARASETGTGGINTLTGAGAFSRPGAASHCLALACFSALVHSSLLCSLGTHQRKTYL
jgi:hypothetical protein